MINSPLDIEEVKNFYEDKGIEVSVVSGEKGNIEYYSFSDAGVTHNEQLFIGFGSALIYLLQICPSLDNSLILHLISQVSVTIDSTLNFYQSLEMSIDILLNREDILTILEGK